MAETLPYLTPADILNTPLPPGWRVIDVRKPAAARGTMLRGARWIDPFRLSFDHPVLKSAPGLVFYCVHGHEVSQFATALSLVAGIPAKYVRGGWDALQSAGAPAEPLSQWKDQGQ